MTTLRRTESLQPATLRLEPVGVEHNFHIQAFGWSVREVFDRELQTRALIFMSTGVGRRVNNYPANWRELSNEALYELSCGR